MSDQVVSATRLIPAPAEEIFALLSDPANHSLIDGSDTVQSSMESEQLTLGSKFGMKMKFLGFPYRITNEVVEFEPAKLIAWRHFGHHIWRYELEAAAGGTQVTESFDWSKARVPAMYPAAGYPDRHKVNRANTLERLEQQFTAR